MSTDPRAEQQMQNDIQQDLGNGLIWFYFVAVDVGLFLGALISGLQQSHGWQWFLLAFIIAVFATYEYGRHRSHKVATAAQAPTPPLVIPQPDPHWRRRFILQSIFVTLYVAGRAWASGDPGAYWSLLIVPIFFYIGWQIRVVLERNKQLRIDQITAQDNAQPTAGPAAP